MFTIVLALLLGVVAGLRALTAPAAASWGAYLGWLHLSGSWLAFLGHPVTPWVLTALALGEIVNDKRPSTPSRTIPPSFGFRIVTGGLSGAAIGVSGGGQLLGGLVAGVAGAVIGTLGGIAARSRLAAAFGRDLPAALLEDAVAVLGALLVVWAASRASGL